MIRNFKNVSGKTVIQDDAVINDTGWPNPLRPYLSLTVKNVAVRFNYVIAQFKKKNRLAETVQVGVKRTAKFRCQDE